MLEFLAPGFIYSALKDALAYIRGRQRRLTPNQTVQIRQKWKEEFERRIAERHSKGLGMDVIIRDVKRVDNYPDVSEKGKGISSWFKAGLMDTYHRGMLAGLRWGTLTKDSNNGVWRYTDYSRGERGDTKVILIGYIRYENIEAVDWNGDEYYGEPHIYCYFDARRKEPYEKLAFCEKHDLNGYLFYTEVVSLEEVERASKKLGIKSNF